jgi:phospholipid/cholesterol/gamma-HCH transport system substrate-binding protein
VSVEAKVGTFVIGCLLLLGVTVFYLGNNQFGGHLPSYKTYLRYAGGLAAGSQVLFGGIESGRVTGVRPSREDPTRIEILFQLKNGTPVNENSVAKLGSVTLMSSTALSITTGTNDAPRLKAGQVIRSEETVSIDDMTRKLSALADGAKGLIVQVEGELKDISGDARTLLANLNDVTGSTNRGNIAHTLDQINSLVTTQSPKIDRITDEVLAVSRDADAVIQKIGPLVNHTDATVSNVNLTIDQLREPIQQDLAKLQSTLDQAQSAMKTIQTLVRANDPNITETIENLRVATENLDQLTEDVKQRPWSLVRIRQPKDRKVPE